MAVLDSTLPKDGSTSLYITLPWLYLTQHYQKMDLLHYTLPYITLPQLYFFFFFFLYNEIYVEKGQRLHK